METVAQNAAFGRPYGTQTTLVVHFPSSKLLGSYQTSLRDEQLPTACVQQRGQWPGLGERMGDWPT